MQKGINLGQYLRFILKTDKKDALLHAFSSFEQNAREKDAYLHFQRVIWLHTSHLPLSLELPYCMA